MSTYQVLIPAYNAAITLPVLLEQLAAFRPEPAAIVVVNDGSNDQTESICADYGITVINLEKNSGKGSALKRGFTAFLMDSDVAYVLCMDADLQHPVESIGDFLSKADRDQSKFIIGARDCSFRAMPFHRILSNKITSYIISLLAKKKIIDSQCGFRLIHRDVLRQIAFSEEGYQLESEMIISAARKGIQIDAVDIPTIYGKEVSHIGHVKDTLLFIRLILREIFR
ncbi:MAG: glycosyltransferase family 2 protein [Calditrichales bacterium]|nr:MAG: glycosyltransferase family 2 protein [Calditrichales bacterium]